jgi:WD40 repeat protein
MRTGRHGTLPGLLILAVILLATGCASINLVATQPPILRLDDIHALGATRVEFDRKGERIATGGYLGEIYIWKVPQGERQQTLKQHEGIVRGLAWIDDNTLLSAAEDGQLLIWNVKTAGIIKAQQGTPITSMVYVPSRKQIITGHDDGHLRSWFYPALKPQQKFRMNTRVQSVAASRDGKQLAASDDAGQVMLLDARLNRIRSLSTNDTKAQELRFSPDGRQLVAGTWFDLYFWDLETGKLTVQKTEHIGAIISVDYTPDGNHLVSLGRHTDANVRLTNVNNGRMARRLRAHNLCGFNIRISPNWRYVASASEDASVRLYDIAAPYNPTWGD